MMKFKAFYSNFGISSALIREDFRRYWTLPAIAVIAYFMCAIFPILMAYNNLTEQGMASYIAQLLANKNPIMVMFNTTLPIITAVVLYKYMHQTGSAAVVHSMPFTRNTLYNSHIAAGLSISIFPTVFCGAIMLLISKPVYPTNYAYLNSSSLYGNLAEQVNVFARSGILTWLWQSVLIIAVIYFLSAFIAAVTGNSILHFVTSGIFLGLMPAFLGTLLAYFQQFIYGFTASDAYADFLLGLCPILQPFRTAGKAFPAGWVIFYLVCIVIFYALGHFLYMNKKLERATESFTFKPMAVFMSYVTAFFGMTAFGFYFYAMSESNEVYMYLGFATGAVLIFLIAELIISRSWHIFHKGTFKKLGIYCAIAVLFLMCINFDVSGYETRIPDASGVKSVYLQEPSFSSTLYGDAGYGINNANRIELSSPENIAAAIRLHKSLTDERNSTPPRSSYKTTSWYFDYTLKNGKTLARQYHSFDTKEFMANNPDVKTIMESQEYKSQILVANLTQVDKSVKRFDPKEFTNIILSGTVGNHSLSAAEQREFYACFKDDLLSRSFEDIIMPKAPFIDVVFEINVDKNPTGQQEYQSFYQYSPSQLRYNLDSSFTKTIGWLKEKAYYEDFIIPVEDVAYVTIDKIQFNEDGYPLYKGAEDGRVSMERAMQAGMPVYENNVSVAMDYAKEQPLSETPPAQTADTMVLTDKDQIDRVLHSYSTNFFSSSVLPLSSYVVTIYIKNPDAVDDMNKVYSLSGYYFDETIPAEFAAYFNK